MNNRRLAILLTTAALFAGMSFAASRAVAQSAPMPARETALDFDADSPWLSVLSHLVVGYDFSSLEWKVREYDNAWILSRNYPGEGREDRYLDMTANTESSFLRLGWKFSDALTAYGKFGTIAGGEESTNQDPGTYDPEPAWGIGVDAVLFRTVDRSVSVLAQFDYENGKSSDWYRGRSPREGDIELWALDVLLSWGIINEPGVALSLLAGLSYSDLHLPYRHPSSPGQPDREGGYEAEDRTGGVFGLKLHILDRVSLLALQRYGSAEGGCLAASITL
ncbi:MAG: hypothetical protein FJ224_11675 [Lentisphaerae bacterium]|nr:hypothetical protein [Lentisphaerota bacterium]